MRKWIAQYQDRLPYLLGLIALMATLSLFRFFWRSNDDVALSLIADGGGMVPTASPHLMLTNIAWGYLVYGVHLLGVRWAYATVTYSALVLSYLALLYAFWRSKIDHRVAAVALLFVFIPTFVNPQHTLVAGYLAFAGIVLLCNSVERGSLRDGYVAAALLVLSSLLRWDEAAFVALVALPFCLGYCFKAWGSDLRRQWLWLLGITSTVVLGFLAMDFLTFGLGDWAEYAKTYGLVMQLNDFKVATYFYLKPAALEGSGYSVNDLKLFSDWFYCDTQVFSPERLTALLDQAPLIARLEHNLRSYGAVLGPLKDTQFVALLETLAVITLFHRRRRYLLGSLLVLAFLMFVLLLLGRPQITRIYLPAITALLLIGVLEMNIKGRVVSMILAVAVIAINVRFLLNLHHRNSVMQVDSVRVQAVTCNLPHDSLVVSWGAIYPFNLNYLPFGGGEHPCPLNNYSLGEYSLAPFALEHLHSYTGGKDLVPALLSGQSFDFIAGRGGLLMLKRYFLDHYQANLLFTPAQKIPGIPIFHVSVENSAQTMLIAAHAR